MLNSLRSTREAPGMQETREAGKAILCYEGPFKGKSDSLRGTREAPGRQERTILDSLGGTREVPGRQERTFLNSLRGTREAPGRQERPFWTAWEAPGRYQGGRKGPFGQPGRHQGGTREAGKAILCYEGPFKGKSVRREGLVPSLKRKIIFGKCFLPLSTVHFRNGV